MIGTVVGCLVIAIVIVLVLGIAALSVASYFFEDALQWLSSPYIPDWVVDVIYWIQLFN
ncbi:hypothetical protein [Shimazuella alba]|jgi:biotin transporter BioY|uniref:Uncharacterized protein n=1 Tax=Shimazuella alba TaxID=2690964 RepID=A0A6I4VVS1_9BACL|nr:hypothetical protein [Shimazuella alba]MXQ53946.1 hypothetical protein [Shimazuella alba]